MFAGLHLGAFMTPTDAGHARQFHGKAKAGDRRPLAVVFSGQSVGTAGFSPNEQLAGVYWGRGSYQGARPGDFYRVPFGVPYSVRIPDSICACVKHDSWTVKLFANNSRGSTRGPLGGLIPPTFIYIHAPDSTVPGEGILTGLNTVECLAPQPWIEPR